MVDILARERTDNVEMDLACDAYGHRFHITDALRGLGCGLFCLDCGRRVIAKQGDQLAWHYAHQSATGDGYPCRYHPQTWVHIDAIEIVHQNPLMLRLCADGGFLPLHAFEHLSGRADKEPFFGSGDLRVRGDVGLPFSEYINIEILVAHPVDYKKQDKLRLLKQATLEIDLREFRSFANLHSQERTRLMLMWAVLEQAPRHWIFPPQMLRLAPITNQLRIEPIIKSKRGMLDAKSQRLQIAVHRLLSAKRQNYQRTLICKTGAMRELIPAKRQCLQRIALQHKTIIHVMSFRNRLHFSSLRFDKAVWFDKQKYLAPKPESISDRIVASWKLPEDEAKRYIFDDD